jgi:membrane-associated phospholipid phosphatase
MFDRLWAPLAGCLACVAALVAVRVLAYRASAQALDARVLHRLSVEHGPVTGAVASFFAYLANPLPQVVLLAVLCTGAWHWGRRREGIAAVALVVGANLTTQVLKAVLSQPRYQSILGSDQIPSTAFPSGHATASMAMALATCLVVPRWLRPTAIAVGTFFVIVIGCSLVLLHWHYPSDVLGGWLVATGWGCAVLAALRIDGTASPLDAARLRRRS